MKLKRKDRENMTGKNIDWNYEFTWKYGFISDCMCACVCVSAKQMQTKNNLTYYRKCNIALKNVPETYVFINQIINTYR